MMKTATDFSLQVRKCEKAIRAAHAANAELLSATKTTMTLPLPQTYEDTNGGAGSATSSLNLVGGPTFKADTVSRVTNESGHKLETEVLAPLTRWQEVHLQLAVSGPLPPGPAAAGGQRPPARLPPRLLHFSSPIGRPAAASLCCRPVATPCVAAAALHTCLPTLLRAVLVC